MIKTLKTQFLMVLIFLIALFAGLNSHAIEEKQQCPNSKQLVSILSLSTDLNSEQLLGILFLLEQMEKKQQCPNSEQLVSILYLSTDLNSEQLLGILFLLEQMEKNSKV